MSKVDSHIAESFLKANEVWLVPLGIALAGFVLAHVVDRALSRRAETLSRAVAGGELSAVAITRLRLIRRLVYTLIVVIGLFMALATIPGAGQVAASLLASSAVLGLVVGFAARQTLANAVAGVLLAITQPIRIGDVVTFEEETGEVEDVRLTYTYIRLDDGRRLIVPNERLAQSSIENHTILDPKVQVQVSVWLPPGADLERALELVADEEAGVETSVAETDQDAVRLLATTWASGPAERGRIASELRQRWLRLLREHGLSSEEAS